MTRRAVIISIVGAMLLASGPGSGGEKKGDWKPLFDGKSLAGWKATDFGGEGEVRVEGGAIVMEQGNNMTGVT
jgi:hypothetical protein